MYLGRVVGCVWATVKNASLQGQRMLVIQPLTPELRNTGKQLICLDCTGAGAGEIIYWVRGREASIALLPAEPPIDTTVVGIVDSIHLQAAPKGAQTGLEGSKPDGDGRGATPEGVPTAPQGQQSAPLGVQTGPEHPAAQNGVRFAPEDAPPSQKAPAVPGARTPTHRKGRRC
jgi:ethanolamine utilization protein EutN